MGDSELKVINLHSDKQCRAYLLVDEARRKAAIVDPRFDVVPAYVAQLKEAGLDLSYAIDTHTHADHLSGSDRLRNLTGCRVVMSDKTKSKVADLKLRDEATLDLGHEQLQFMHTPGHTPDSMCVRLDHTLLTGDTLFIGGSARTDFMGGSAAALFDSFRRIEALGPDVRVLPGHDYNNRVATTIGDELAHNPVFREHDKSALVKRLSIKGELPLNMREMLAFNVEAGLREDVIIKATDSALADVTGRFTVLDVRTDAEWEAGHIAGAIHIGLDQLDRRFGELAGLKRPLLAVCKSGVRATLAVMNARLRGEAQCILLEGGMDAWAAAHRPLVAEGGRKPQIIAMAGGPSAACAAGGTCASSAPAGIEVFAGAAHSWSDWVI